MPLPKQLGQKYGRKFPAIKAALGELDPLAVAHAVEAGQPVEVTVDGETLAILPDEVQVRKQPKPGLAVAEDAGYLVAVTTELTDALRWEGYAREVVRNIQELRKKSGFEISDRICDDRAIRPRAGAHVARVRRRHRARDAVDALRARCARRRRIHRESEPGGAGSGGRSAEGVGRLLSKGAAEPDIRSVGASSRSLPRYMG